MKNYSKLLCLNRGISVKTRKIMYFAPLSKFFFHIKHHNMSRLVPLTLEIQRVMGNCSLSQRTAFFLRKQDKHR